LAQAKFARQEPSAQPAAMTLLLPSEPGQRAPGYLANAGWGADDRLQRLTLAMDGKEAGDVEPLRVAIEVAAAGGASDEELQQAAELLRQLEQQQEPLTFADVPRPEMEELQRIVSREAAVAILSRCLGLEGDENFQALILAEFHYHNFAFCQRSGFNAEKASTTISIFKAVHTKAIVQDRLSGSVARSLFAALVDRHSQQLPPYRVGVYSREEAAAVKAYADRTFFRHYKMYAFAYIQQQELIVRSAFERVAPAVPVLARYDATHEVDPRQVPELQDLFQDPCAAALREDANAAMATVPILEQHLRAHARGSSPFANEREGHVSAAIDEAMQEHLSTLEPRLSVLPPV